MRQRWSSLTFLLLALPALGAPNASLEKAARLYGDLNYTDAAKALDAALKQPGNDRATLLKILELQAVVQATLGQPERAAKVFEQLLTVDPEFKLAGNYPPRVTTAFYEARGWAEANGHLEVKPLDALLEPGRVKGVRLEVTKDPLKLVKKVRFHLGDQELLANLAGNVATAAPKAPAAELKWWAELLGERDAVLLEVGTAASPRVEQAPATPGDAPVATATPVAEPVAEDSSPSPPPAAVSRPSAPISGKQIAAFALFGGAAIAAAVGIAVGVNANSLKAQVDQAKKNSSGQISGLTQVQAYQLDASQRTQASVANALYITAGALAVGGGALFALTLFGSDSRAQLVPTGPGVAVVGTFP